MTLLGVNIGFFPSQSVVVVSTCILLYKTVLIGGPTLINLLTMVLPSIIAPLEDTTGPIFIDFSDDAQYGSMGIQT